MLEGGTVLKIQWVAALHVLHNCWAAVFLTDLELLFDLHQQLLTPGAVLGLAGLPQVHAQSRDLTRAKASAAALELVHLPSATSHFSERGRSKLLLGCLHMPRIPDQ